MKLFISTLLLVTALSGCTGMSTSFSGNFTDEQGRTFGGSVSFDRNDSKQVRDPKVVKPLGILL